LLKELAMKLSRFVGAMALLVAAGCGGAAPAAAQMTPWDVPAMVEFQRAVDGYAFLHRQVERRLNLAHRRDPGKPQEMAEMAAAMREARPAAEGSILAPAVGTAIREALAAAARAPGCDPGELRSGPWQPLRIHDSAAATKALPACIAAALPHLPEELEFRSAGSVLVLVDRHLGVVVDVLPAALVNSEGPRR